MHLIPLTCPHNLTAVTRGGVCDVEQNKNATEIELTMNRHRAHQAHIHTHTAPYHVVASRTGTRAI